MTLHYSAWIAMVRTVNDCIRYNCKKKNYCQQPSLFCMTKMTKVREKGNMSIVFMCLQNRSERCSSHQTRESQGSLGQTWSQRWVSKMPARKKNCRQSASAINGVRSKRSEKEVQKAMHVSVPHAHVGQNRSEKDIIPKSRCHERSSIDRVHTEGP